MNSGCIQKMRGFRRKDDRAPGGRRGSISMIAVIISVAFSIMGLGMLFLSQIHLKASAARERSMILDYASENGIKRGFQELDEALDATDRLVEISDEQLEEIRSEATSGRTATLETRLGWAFPRFVRETRGGMSWESTTTCRMDRLEEHGDFCEADYLLQIESQGGLSAYRPKRVSQSDSILNVLAGRIPLPAIPLLINKKMSEDEEKDFLKSNGIMIRENPEGGLSTRIETGENPIIPGDALPLLAQALKLELTKPEDLDNRILRLALGLAASDEPVPEGVYLIKDSFGLGGIFVQGDADEMIAAIDGDSQILRIRTGSGEWTLRFNPAQGTSTFATPEGASSFDEAPEGIILVNGTIGALGGGTVDSSGEVSPLEDEAAPSILAGVQLTIVSSESITISTHLFSQGVRWREGIPHSKDPGSPLILYSTGKDLLDGSAREGRIAVDEGSPAKLTVQATLIAKDQGLVLGGRGKSIELLGGVQAEDYSSGGNSLRISPNPATDPSFYRNAPRTLVPMLRISAFQVVQWEEYHDEDEGIYAH